MTPALAIAVPGLLLMVGSTVGAPDWLDSVSRVGVVGFLVLALFGLYRRWWVPGWAYRDLEDRHKKLNERYEAAIDIALSSSRGVEKTATIMDAALARASLRGTQ